VRPRIVVTTSRRVHGPAGVHPTRQRPPRPEVYLLRAYLDAVAAGGGLPLPVAPVEGLEEELADWVLAHADGVVVSGGSADLDPAHYGEAPRVPYPDLDPSRAALELRVARGCLERGLPILGVCGGMQALAVAAGGRLLQDIATDLSGALEHQQPTPPDRPWHEVAVTHGPLRDLLGARREVNSTHHQAVRDPGALRCVGWAPDGVVEAVDLPDHPWCVGVQWHPEALDGALYGPLCAAALSRLRI
jgi:putative glutamine amidotransferase